MKKSKPTKAERSRVMTYVNSQRNKKLSPEKRSAIAKKAGMANKKRLDGLKKLSTV